MWKFGDMLETVAASASPGAAAFAHGDRSIAWPDAITRMRALAAALIAGGAKGGDKVGFYLQNGIEYGELAGATFLAELVHVNVNYRYGANEICYILDNADATVLVYSAQYRGIVEQISDRLPRLAIWVEVGAEPPPAFAQGYEELVERGRTLSVPRRSADDALVFTYTGGTTGMPKAVMYSQNDLAPYLIASSGVLGERPPLQSYADLADLVASRGENGQRAFPVCPQMHATGFFMTMWTMLTGGCVITGDTSGAFDADTVWRTAAKHQATGMAIVGDAFARPLLAALEENAGAYDLGALEMIGSSGAIWSEPVKRDLLRHLPQVRLVDVLASSETMGVGASVMTAQGGSATATFASGPDVIVIDEHDRKIPPGPDCQGRLAVGGMQPLGYYKDPDKTARAFKTIDGVRYSIPGDIVRLDSDGTMTLLGRGSACINTAGEKVYPEEVEEILKLHEDIEDALVFGMKDERWGQAVTAVVRPVSGRTCEEDMLRAHVRSQLAGYKVPKRIVSDSAKLRTPSGKPDYQAAVEIVKQIDSEA